MLGALASALRQEKEIQIIHTEKEEISFIHRQQNCLSMIWQS